MVDMTNSKKILDKILDSLSESHEKLMKINQNESFDKITEYLIHNVLNLFGTEGVLEGILSFLSYIKRINKDTFNSFKDEFEKLK